MKLQTTITGLFVGKIQQRWPGRPASAIAKQATSERQELGRLGFKNDEQADLQVHGGIEKAVHHYAAEHYEVWRREIPEHSKRFIPGGFGENISTIGIREEDLCIGDILALGSAKVQVSQGRQPCWKLNAHLNYPSMVAQFQASGRTGWYYRVIERGVVTVGDSISLLERPNPNWPLNVVIKARFSKSLSTENAMALGSIPELAKNWRAAFSKKAERGYQEDSHLRLFGPVSGKES